MTRAILGVVVLAAAATGCFVDEGSPPAASAGTTQGSTTNSAASASEASAGSTMGTTAEGTSAITGTSTDAGTSSGEASTTGDPTTSASTSGGTVAPGVCGDGVVDPGEACDDGDDDNTDACTDACALAVCGDGLVHAGVEACDDGNAADGDGCSATCAIEAPTKLYAFVTMGTFNGNLGGLANADSKCASEASNNGLAGTFYAWLSVDDDAGPLARFTQHELPIVLPGEDEPLVALGTEHFFSGSHAAAIDRGADGLPVASGNGDCNQESLAWTGTNNDGTPHSDRCLDFMNGDFGMTGLAGKVKGNGSAWSAHCSARCSWSLRLYCVQQP